MPLSVLSTTNLTSPCCRSASSQIGDELRTIRATSPSRPDPYCVQVVLMTQAAAVRDRQPQHDHHQNAEASAAEKIEGQRPLA